MKVLLASAVSFALALAPPALAQCQWKELGSSFTADERNFGLSVAVAGDTAVVGAPGTFTEQTPGAAYVFQVWGLWSDPVAKLTPSDGDLGDDFGVVVAVDGDTIVVGAPFHDAARGSAYVFERRGGSWLETQELQAPDGQPSQYFGRSVGISGDTIVVGASSADGVKQRTGAAYVFALSGGTWIQETKLYASDGEEYDLLGWSIAVDGDWVVVGAVQESELAHWAGAAYVFLRGLPFWHEQKLLPDDGAGSDFFGHAVDISGDTLVVSSHTDNGPAGSNQGSAYVFELDAATWMQQQKLTASDAASWVFFGESVGLDGDQVVVGCMWDAEVAEKAGAAYVFGREGTTWTEEAKLLANDGTTYDQLGIAVAIHGQIVVAGANQPDPYSPHAGTVYVFDLGRGRAWTTCVSAPGSTGVPAELGFSGSLGAGADDFELVATDCPPGTPALFFCGLAEATMPVGGGLLCIHPHRMGPWFPWPPVQVDRGGEARMRVDFGALDSLRPLIRDTWYFQLAYLDRIAGGAWLNFSNGLGVRFCP